MDTRPRRLCLAVAFGPKRDANSYADCYSNRYGNADTDGYADGDANCNCHTDTYRHTNTYRIANSITDTHAIAYTYSSAIAQYLYPGASVSRR